MGVATAAVLGRGGWAGAGWARMLRLGEAVTWPGLI